MGTGEGYNDCAQRNRERWADARHGAEAWRRDRWRLTHGQSVARARCTLCSWATVVTAPESVLPAAVFAATWGHVQVVHLHHGGQIKMLSRP